MNMNFKKNQHAHLPFNPADFTCLKNLLCKSTWL